MGNNYTISAGEVQVMSAGSGLTHSEYNNSPTEDVKFLQIWVYPKERNIAPRYDQKMFDPKHRKNKFQLIVSPEESEKTVWINQNSWLSLADIDEGEKVIYQKMNNNSGVYFFILEGDAAIDEHEVHRRDGLGLDKGEGHQITAITPIKILAIEVPLTNE